MTDWWRWSQFDVLTMIRPRRGSMRRLLVRDVSLRGGALFQPSETGGASGLESLDGLGSEHELDGARDGFSAVRSM
jgi:hypothetical protein